MSIRTVTRQRFADRIRSAAATVREAAATVVRAAEPVINGASSAWAEDNGLGGNPGPQSSVGRGIGHAVALAQSGAEMVVAGGIAVEGHRRTGKGQNVPAAGACP